MDTANAVRTLTRPILIILLTLGWIIFIGEGIDTPAAYEAITAAAIGEWVLERGVHRLRSERSIGLRKAEKSSLTGK